MATTTELPRLIDIDSRDLPGIRTLIELDNGDLLAGTLASEVRLISQGQLRGEWSLISDQGKASALERIRALSLFGDQSGFYAAAGVSLWRVNFGEAEPVWSTRIKESFGFMLNSPHTALTLPGDLLWTSTDSGEIQVRSSTGAILRRRSDNHSPHHAALLADGRVAGADGTALCVWDAETLKRQVYLPQEGSIFSFVACPRTARAAIKVDGSVLIWDLKSEEKIGRFAAAPGLGLMGWSAAADILAIGVDDGLLLHFLDGSPHKMLRARSGARILCMAFGLTGEFVFVGCDDGSIQRFPVG